MTDRERRLQAAADDLRRENAALRERMTALLGVIADLGGPRTPEQREVYAYATAASAGVRP